MKHLASIALTAALALGSVLSAALPAASTTLGSSSTASNVILVQERGTRRYPDYDRRPYWRDRDYDRRHWRERRWERRHWHNRWRDDRWRDDRRYYRRHHSGVILEIRP
ncbi:MULTISPECIES: hypothetical protein [Rhizobium]|uniref:BA14K family protein n=1 Tax=Rhizobium tropici TaxID=398 RepID=A0A329YM58_RHITR|nr:MULTISPECIES: hypothetical protein [Rhizobium]MBB3288970.1 hypothetical protein [Rhizobium sp. BK252]MBB3403712.1 hypothetical protein [Rhizobium sp. BK289]MBB3416102.1 hypothetical protein [Rhizobium sp. BK284]MBB3484175.1 hypothetical protein [Rhizobium sp. BK347]MDK4720077.1 hypothetical protein [Rhizobium sp. CNPSo 3968]